MPLQDIKSAETIAENNIQNPNYKSEYHEMKIGKTTYRVTNIYMGQFELGKALEELAVRKILRDEKLNSISNQNMRDS